MGTSAAARTFGRAAAAVLILVTLLLLPSVGASPAGAHQAVHWPITVRNEGSYVARVTVRVSPGGRTESGAISLAGHLGFAIPAGHVADVDIVALGLFLSDHYRLAWTSQSPGVTLTLHGLWPQHTSLSSSPPVRCIAADVINRSGGVVSTSPNHC